MLSGASQVTLHSVWTCKMLSQEYREKIEQHFSCALLTGASRITLTPSGLQHCIGILSSLCRLNTSQNIAQENYLCIVGLKHTVIFLQENNL